jgi:hypothetical protein
MGMGVRAWGLNCAYHARRGLRGLDWRPSSIAVIMLRVFFGESRGFFEGEVAWDCATLPEGGG